MSELLKIHIGNRVRKEGWVGFNVQPGPEVDVVGNCLDLSAFANNSASTIYASHVYEHLDYRKEVEQALKEAHRVLAPGGKIMIAVPDLDVLCHMMTARYLPPEVKFQIMRMILGGHQDPYDIHKSGYNEAFMAHYLTQARFERILRLPSFNLFEDGSMKNIGGVPISLCVEATKPR
jgi:predicted SAM-dependent methyltransferase